MYENETPTPNNDFEHVAFEVVRVISSLEQLNKMYGGKLAFAVKLARQALEELDEVEIENEKQIN